MGKSKKKKKSNQGIASNPLKSSYISLAENIGAEELQHIIAKAIIEAEEIRAQKEKKQREAACAEWHSVIGYKKYKNKIRQFFNGVKVFIKILFLPQKDIKEDRFSTTLLKCVISNFFVLLKLGSLFLAVLLIASVAAQYIVQNIDTLPWYINSFIILLGILVIAISRIFRTVSIEVENIDDRNYIFGFFASVTSIVSIIIAIIAIVRGA